jgi:hypothetical protein
MQVPEYKDRLGYYLDEIVNGVLLPAKCGSSRRFNEKPDH